MLPGAALTHGNSHGLAVLRVQGLAHRRDSEHFRHNHLVLEVKESTAARMQAALCQLFMGDNSPGIVLIDYSSLLLFLWGQLRS